MSFFKIHKERVCLKRKENVSAILLKI